MSRVGAAAQPYALRLVVGSMKYQLAQYREYLIFAQFDNDVDLITKGILNKGALLTEILKQKPQSPLKLWEQTLVILAAAHGFMGMFIKDYKKDLENICKEYERELLHYAISKKEIAEFFYPFYEYLPLIEKGDMNFNDNPLLFILNSFELEYYKIHKKIEYPW